LAGVKPVATRHLDGELQARGHFLFLVAQEALRVPVFERVHVPRAAGRSACGSSRARRVIEKVYLQNQSKLAKNKRFKFFKNPLNPFQNTVSILSYKFFKN